MSLGDCSSHFRDGGCIEISFELLWVAFAKNSKVILTDTRRILQVANIETVSEE